MIDFPILNRWTGEVQFTAKIEADKTTPYGVKVGLAVKWAIKTDADLTAANLTRADLTAADLSRVNLTASNLTDANLTRADLTAANLTRANLSRANLSRVNLTDANLTGTNLNGASLNGAKNLGDFIMPDGLKFSEYLRDVVPALLTAGGKTLEEIRASGAWDCHDWSNCPMHAAFGIDSPDQGPPHLRPRIREFVQFFDAGLIPAPWAVEAVADPT